MNTVLPETTRVLMLPYFSLNPYQVLLKKGLIEHGIEIVEGQMSWKILESATTARAGAIHFHWLHPWSARTRLLRFFYEFPRWKKQIAKLKESGIRIVWTVHNLKDHDNRSPYADQLFCQHMAKVCDVVICHSEQASEEVSRYYQIPGSKIQTIPHGNYLGWYKNEKTKFEARKHLGIPNDAKVIVALGELRPYKNTLELVEAFKAANIDNSLLLIAGRCKERNYQQRLETALKDDLRIKSHLRYIPDDEIQLFMNASDLAALPYRDSLTSGAALLAMSFGLPILAPRIRCFEELPGENGAVLYDNGHFGLADGIKTALTAETIVAKGEYNKKLVHAYDWSTVGASTADTYGSKSSNCIIN